MLQIYLCVGKKREIVRNMWKTARTGAMGKMGGGSSSIAHMRNHRLYLRGKEKNSVLGAARVCILFLAGRGSWCVRV